ncbi:MAG: hypothetical protein M3025_06190, partial [Actinomycetota bacterium]|nr:hypothetical protein [Actinomycetota bacterium]
MTDNDPAYEEQATFTPDMREVIVMTSRARPGTWYQTVITAAQWLRFDAPDPGSDGTPMFLADFSDPKFTSDLYMFRSRDRNRSPADQLRPRDPRVWLEPDLYE